MHADILIFLLGLSRQNFHDDSILRAQAMVQVLDGLFGTLVFGDACELADYFSKISDRLTIK